MQKMKLNHRNRNTSQHNIMNAHALATGARAALDLNLFLLHPPPWVKKWALKVNIFSSKMYMSASFDSYISCPKVLIVHGPKKKLCSKTQVLTIATHKYLAFYCFTQHLRMILEVCQWP